MVCHLSGPDQLGALTKQSAEKLLEWDERGFQDGVDESGIRTPNEFVANASELFERLHCSATRIEGKCGGVISITEQQRKSFERLHKLRNKLSHFSPKGWSIELSFIEQIIGDVLNIMCLIADDCWPFRHMTEQDRNTLRSKIEEVRSLLSLS